MTYSNGQKFLSSLLTIFLIAASPSHALASKDTTPGDPPYLIAQAPRPHLSVDPSMSLAQANTSAPLNIEDLGFSKSETNQDENLQRLLNRRTKMLKIHQILGLTTAVAMALALSEAGGTSSTGASGKSQREDHEKYGIASGVLYFTTAGFSIFAPEIHGEQESGRTKIHKWLAFIHFPAMVGTMILGIRDKKKLDRGEDTSGLKPAFATTAAVAFYTSLAVMVIPFGGKGDKK